MDETTINRVDSQLRRIAADHDVDIDRIVYFGSRVRDDYEEESDIDIILVSSNFQGQPTYKRPAPFYREWPYDDLPEPELICLTPDEYDEQRRRKPHIVREATETGMITT